MNKNRFVEDLKKFILYHYKPENEDYKDEVFNMFVQALLDLKLSGMFKNESEDFFLHLEISDHWIDEKMLERISLLHSKKRFEEYKIYAKEDED